MKYIGFIVLGFVTGVIGSYLGIGGGVIIVTSLVLFFKCEIKTAIGTSLAVIFPAALMGAIVHYSINSNNVLFMVTIYMIPAAIIGSRIGVSLVNKIHGKYLQILFAVFLIFMGIRQMGIIDISVGEISNAGSPFLYVILGLAAGISSALFGIGGGIIIVPGLSVLANISIHQAIGTSLAVILPLSLAGAIFHSRFKNINLVYAGFLAPSAFLGAMLGAFLSNAASPDSLHTILGMFIILCSVKLFIGIKNT